MAEIGLPTAFYGDISLSTPDAYINLEQHFGSSGNTPLYGSLIFGAREHGDGTKKSGLIVVDKDKIQLLSQGETGALKPAEILLVHGSSSTSGAIWLTGEVVFDTAFLTESRTNLGLTNIPYTTTAANIVSAGVCDVNDAGATVLDGICNIGFDGNKTDATDVTTSTVLWTIAAAYRPRATVQVPCLLKSGSNMAFRRAIVHPDGTVTLNVAMGTAAFDCTVCGSYSIMTS